MEIDLKKLVQFKINACQKTYASGKNQVKSCRKDSHDYSYAEGDFRYYDSFVGSKNSLVNSVSITKIMLFLL